MKCNIKRIRKINSITLKSLISDSEDNNVSFVTNTVADWINGTNRFDKEGEFFLGAYINDEIVGMGGLNIDPYMDHVKTGRVRHLYVSSRFRRQKIGQQLMLEIIKNAKQYYEAIRLYTENKDAFLFYESFGFQRSSKYKESHILKF